MDAGEGVDAIEVSLAVVGGIAPGEREGGLDERRDLHGVVAVAEEALALAPDGGHGVYETRSGRTRCEGRLGRGETATAAAEK